jgi:hypothetical protein
MEQRDKERLDERALNLFGDTLVLYLSVGSALGDCPLYRRMGEALALAADAADPGGLPAAISEFKALPPAVQRSILRGDPLSAPDTPARAGGSPALEEQSAAATRSA